MISERAIFHADRKSSVPLTDVVLAVCRLLLTVINSLAFDTLMQVIARSFDEFGSRHTAHA